MSEPIRKYELGGVLFVIVDGEVYCRYEDVFEEEADTEETEEEAGERQKAKRRQGWEVLASHPCRLSSRALRSARRCRIRLDGDQLGYFGRNVRHRLFCGV